MTITFNPSIQDHTVPQSFSLDEESEKTKKIAIDTIILYLKDMDNTISLKRLYSDIEVFEFLDSINIHRPPCKKMKVSEKSTERTLDTSSFLQHTDKESRRRFDIVFEAVKRDGLELQYASRRLQNNFTIILQAVQQNGLALQYASKEQLQSTYLALQAVRENGLALQYLSLTLRDKFDIVAAAVRQNRLALRYASKRLQNDHEIIEFTRIDKNLVIPKFNICNHKSFL